MKKKINLILLVVLVMIILTGCMEENEPVLIEFGETGIHVYSDWEWGRDISFSGNIHDGNVQSTSSNYITAEGTIVNAGTEDYSYLELWADFYKDGYIIAKEFTNFVDFNVGEKRDFEIMAYLPSTGIDDVRIRIKNLR